MAFRLATLATGSNPIYWDTLQDILGEADIPFEPDASYQPYAETVTLADGQRRGMGLPIATWIMTLTKTQKYLLRQFCTGASTSVYIETPTNDFDVSGNQEWIQAGAIMEWQDGEEDIDAEVTRDLTIRFTHLVAIT